MNAPTQVRPGVFSGIQPVYTMHEATPRQVDLTHAAKARRIAVETMREVRPAMGLGSGASAP
jgi:hypothetical protein